MLFITKKLWVPTLWGWLLLSALSLGIFTLLVRHGYPFLAMEAPSGAKLLVIEGWMAPSELDQAIVRFRSGGYRRVITTGGPVPVNLYQPVRTTFAALAREYLIHRGLPGEAVVAVATPASARDRTYLSAVMVREWMAGSGGTVDAFDVFSEGAHSRRTHLLYRLAFGNSVRIGILAAAPENYNPSAWWQSSVGTKTVVTEAIGWAWTALFFDAGPRGSHEEKWAIRPQGKSEPLQ
jgi:hypothetical protein